MGKSEKYPGKVLVVLPIGLGNFILATPALKELSRQLGSGSLQLLALKPGIAEMARASGWFGKVHVWDPDRQPFIRGLGLIRDLRREKWDHLLSFYPTSHWKFNLFSALCGAGKLWGFRYPESPVSTRVYHHLVSVEPVHDVEQNLNLVKFFLSGGRLGEGSAEEKSLGEVRLSFPAGPALHLEERLKDRRYFVCHPGSSNERGMWRKRLPPSKFSDIIGRIHTQTGLSCVLIGGPEEQFLRDEIKGGAIANNAFLEQPTQSLAELRGVIHGAKFFLGNDSGMMHMAAALEKSCIAFFGPSDENRTGPWPPAGPGGVSPHLVLRNPEFTPKADASKSVRARYEGTAGLDTLKVEAVWPRIESFLERLV